MHRYILKKIFFSFLTLIIVSFFIFLLIHLQPGNPYFNMIKPNMSSTQVHSMLKKLGYYDPLLIKYFKWLCRVLKFDLGYSTYFGISVSSVILERIFNTIILSVSSLILSIVISVPIGIFCAYKPKNILSIFFSSSSLIGICFPTFFLGLILIKIFSYDLRIFPVSGVSSLSFTDSYFYIFLDYLHHLFLPCIVLSSLQSSYFIRFIKSQMINVLKQEYIKTAKAKGCSTLRILINHAFRNCLIPLTTLLCMQIPSLFSGALITETLFVWPGIGRLSYEAVFNRDYPLVLGILLISSIIVIISNLLADFLYVVLDLSLIHI